MSVRRELTAAIGLCLVASAVQLFALGRPWYAVAVGAAPLPARLVTVSGAQLAPGAQVLALVGLAGVAGLPATRRAGRTLVGLVLAAAGVGSGAVLAGLLAHPRAAVLSAGPLPVGPPARVDLGAWPYLALLASALLVVVGVLVVARGRRWTQLSARYEPPTGRPAAGPESWWDALDRGEDPTRAAGVGADPARVAAPAQDEE